MGSKREQPPFGLTVACVALTVAGVVASFIPVVWVLSLPMFGASLVISLAVLFRYGYTWGGFAWSRGGFGWYSEPTEWTLSCGLVSAVALIFFAVKREPLIAIFR